MRRGNMWVAKIAVGLNGRPLLLFADSDLCLHNAIMDILACVAGK